MHFVSNKNNLTGHRIVITDHAVERFVQRFTPIGNIITRVAVLAFERGTPKQFTDKELQEWFQAGLLKDGWFNCVYKEYKGYIFVFQNSKKNKKLITILKSN